MGNVVALKDEKPGFPISISRARIERRFECETRAAAFLTGPTLVIFQLVPDPLDLDWNLARERRNNTDCFLQCVVFYEEAHSALENSV